MANKVQQIVDYYLTLTGKDDTEYKKHLRSAKELLTLCDENPEQAEKVLDVCSRMAIGDWSIYWAIKKWPEISIKV